MIAIVLRGMMKLRNKGIHASHIWILNLAVSDLLTVMLSIPLHTTIESQTTFTFGAFVCTGTEAVAVLCDWVSMSSVFFMATTRAIGVLFPFDYKFLRQKVFNYSAVAATWFTGLLVIIPILMYQRVKSICEVPYSVPYWPKESLSFAPNGYPMAQGEVLLTWDQLANNYTCDMNNTVIPGWNPFVNTTDVSLGHFFYEIIKQIPGKQSLRV